MTDEDRITLYGEAAIARIKAGDEESAYMFARDAFRFAQQTDEQRQAKLATELQHAIAMEAKAATRVKRAASLLHKWSAARRRIERRLGEQAVRHVTNRLTMGQPATEDSEQ